MGVFTVVVRSAASFEALRDLPGSLSGDFTPDARRGEVLFGSATAAREAAMIAQRIDKE